MSSILSRSTDPKIGVSSKLRRLHAKSGEQKAPGQRPRADYRAQSIIPRRVTTVHHLTNPIQAVILKHRKGAAGRRLAPQISVEVTAIFVRDGRLLLIFGLHKQVANADDDQTKL